LISCCDRRFEVRKAAADVLKTLREDVIQWLQRKERAASGVAQATTRDVSTFKFETPSAWPASQQHHVGRQLSRPSGFHHR
jgi:hypothetical protein